MFLGQEDDTTPLPTPKDKQDFIQKIFHDDLNGGRQFECYLLETTTSSGEKNKERVLYGSKVVWENNGLVILMISNPRKTITKHENFRKRKEKDEPWCHVLIDNRYDREFIAIEKNTAFSSPDFVAAINSRS